jgi:ribonuclease P protein component
MSPKGLRTAGQFRRIYSEGRREAGKRIIIYYLKTGEGGVLPGFVASKKNVGNRACQRNRAKRLMREVYSKLAGRIKERNLWIVFIASFDPAETSLGQLTEDVERSLERAGLISNGE